MRNKYLSICGLLTALTAGAALADDGADSHVSAQPHPSVVWTGGMGIASPFVVSVSGGAIVPLGSRGENSRDGFPGTPALRADVDVGLGGGMVSAGISIPSLAGTSMEDEIILKGGLLRTWLFDAGPGKYKTYKGIIAEMIAPVHFANTKFSLGYFRRNESFNYNPHFLYAFVGIGFS